MEYTTLVSHADQELRFSDVGSSEDMEDDAALLHPFETLPSRLVSKAAVRKYSITIVVQVLICVILVAGLIAIVLKYTMSKAKRRDLSLIHFVQISDTHLDLYYDSRVTNKNEQFCRNRQNKLKDGGIERLNTTATFGRIGCDSPARLLESLQIYIRKVSDESEDGVEFILLTGDQVGHDYKLFHVDLLDSVLWSLGNSTKILSDALPGIPLLISIGNNDLMLDYEPPVSNHSTFYQSLYHVFERYVFPEGSDIEHLNSKDEFKKTFQQGGYYSVIINEGKTLVVVLNTNYWSAKSYEMNKNITIIGDLQMSWLREQLLAAKANEQRVIISGHIPPGIDAFNRKSLWLYEYAKMYNNMVTHRFRHVISAQLYGHIHQDKIKIQSFGDNYLGNNTNKSFLLTCPSVTPIFKNNPAFRIYDYDEEEQVLHDYTQYYFDLAASNVNKESYWFKEYSFRETYDVELTVDGVEQIIDKFLQPSSSAWYNYSQHIRARSGTVPYYERYAEFCAAKYYIQDVYTNCTMKYRNAGV